MESRPPSAAGLAVVLALACGHAGLGPAPTEPGPLAPTAAVSLAPPPVLAPGELEPAVDAAVDVQPEPATLPEPTVELPEITALALARQVLAAEAPRLDDEQREQVARVLADAEQELGLEVMLVLALITQESRFDPRAVGPAGSLGLMQIHPFVGQDIAGRYGLPWAGDGTLLEPVHNVRLGTYYLAELIDMFGEPELALAAYNMGPYRVRRMLRQGGAPSLRFVDRVYEHYEVLQERFGKAETGWGG
jgi:hypothetical protein